MTDAEKAEVKKFRGQVRVHEDGHFQVAAKVASDNTGDVTSEGATEEEARDGLQAALDKHQADVNAKLQRTAGDGGEYDKATDHGRKQSKGPEAGFPGGEDIRLRCP